MTEERTIVTPFVDTSIRSAPSMTWPCGCTITFKVAKDQSVFIEDASRIPCPLHGLAY